MADLKETRQQGSGLLQPRHGRL